MAWLQTKATVDSQGRLKIIDKIPPLKEGQVFDIIILMPGYQSRRKQWKRILNSLGTYCDEDLKEIKQVKKGLAHWEPEEY